MYYSPITAAQRQSLLEKIGVSQISELFADVLGGGEPPKIDLPDPASDLDVQRDLRFLASRNQTLKSNISFLGGGVYEHFIPSVIGPTVTRSEFLTAYTPYQPELSQGTLKSIFEFQTMVAKLMGLEISNASLYDGASALAEACVMAYSHTKKSKILIPETLHPNYQSVLKTYLNPKGCDLQIFKSKLSYRIDLDAFENALSEEHAAVVLPYPDFYGNIYNFSKIIETAKAKNCLVIVPTYPIMLGILKSPGDLGADIATAEGQCCGIPASFGGPYVGMLACKKELLRLVPGRMVGETVDQDGNVGYCLTFQTREQHIRREKSLSNICTNQALLALTATMYLAYMGPEGLRQVATLCHKNARFLLEKLSQLKTVRCLNSGPVFNEFILQFEAPIEKVIAHMTRNGIFPGVPLAQFNPDLKNALLVAVTENRNEADLLRYVKLIGEIE